MARLSGVPTEITLTIISLLLPDDIDSFTSTCKNIHYIAKSYFEIHWDLKRKHSAYRFCDYLTSESRCSPLQLLDEILREPRMAFYVREITTEGWCWMWNQDPERLHLPYSKQTMTRLRDAVLELAPQKEVPAWLTPISVGDEGPIISMLLLLLPNLSTLRFKRLGASARHIFHTIHRITMMKGPGVPLSRLRHAEVPELKLVEIIAALPSIVSIHGHDIKATTENWPDDMTTRSSSLRDLTLTKCSFNEKSLFDILGGFKALRSLTYKSDYRNATFRMDQKVNPVPYWVRSALSAYASPTLVSTLESLTLLSNDKDRNFIGKLWRFKNLRHLHTGTQLLLSEDSTYGGDESLAGALPPKLQTLNLECSGRGDEIGIAKLITELAALKTERVPALEKVEVFTRNGVRDFNASGSCARRHTSTRQAAACYDCGAIFGACRSAGIDLVVKAFDPAVIQYYNL